MFKIEKFVHSVAAKHYGRRAQIDAARAQRAKNMSSVVDSCDEKDILTKKHNKLKSRAMTAAINKDYHKALSVDGYNAIEVDDSAEEPPQVQVVSQQVQSVSDPKPVDRAPISDEIDEIAILE